ncbi:hypothetical protein HPB52_021333 [Rhipicephalus sanguineus]|uniref:CCHC-type domain-containing protein n=1 Tax=Rhipicephalus sanguineus TaxID=34632 RepID=A0A9D4PE07_RHISA|nr:hypothetical protein HPB52_021333 [Rhipicephalus sanguineus]
MPGTIVVEAMDINSQGLDEAGWTTALGGRRKQPTSTSPYGGQDGTKNTPAGSRTAISPAKSFMKQITAASRLPTLPKDQMKIILRPKGGLNVSKADIIHLAQALAMAVALTEQQTGEDTVCPNKVVVCYECGHVGHRADVCASSAEEKKCRGCGEAKSSESEEGVHQCTPKCEACGGPHITGDRTCRHRYHIPYIVRRRRRRRGPMARQTQTAGGDDASLSYPQGSSATPTTPSDSDGPAHKNRGTPAHWGRDPDPGHRTRNGPRRPTKKEDCNGQKTRGEAQSEQVNDPRIQSLEAENQQLRRELAELKEALNTIREQFSHRDEETVSQPDNEDEMAEPSEDTATAAASPARSTGIGRLASIEKTLGRMMAMLSGMETRLTQLERPKVQAISRLTTSTVPKQENPNPDGHLRIGTVSEGPYELGNCGTPQCSVLFPLLFNIAMHKLSTRIAAIPNVGHAIYADDITIWAPVGSLAMLEHSLQSALEATDDFLSNTGLELSPDKLELLLYRPSRQGAENAKLDSLTRPGLKRVLSYPHFTSTEKLLELGLRNTADELIKAHTPAQITRLSSTKPGIKLLAEAGIQPRHEQATKVSLSRENRNRIMVDPVRRNIQVHHKGGNMLNAASVYTKTSYVAEEAAIALAFHSAKAPAILTCAFTTTSTRRLHNYFVNLIPHTVAPGIDDATAKHFVGWSEGAMCRAEFEECAKSADDKAGSCADVSGDEAVVENVSGGQYAHVDEEVVGAKADELLEGTS